MSERRDVVVVGAGVMGLASAWALKRAGRDVTVLEQFDVGHPYGSSHGASRIFRFAYSETDWVALAQEALPLWRELEAESGTEVLSLTGLLDSSGDSAALRSALEACSAEYEVLEEGEAARRFGIELEGEIVLELHGGIVRADRALAAFSRGIPVENGVRVLALQANGEGVTLETSAGAVEAALAVVAAGAWATPLLADAGIELETNVSQETVAYFDLPGADELPSVIDWNWRRRAATRTRCRPARTSSRSGCTTRACRSSPVSRGEPDPEVVEAESEWVRRRYPAADPTPRGAETCLYTNIEEDRFVTERHGTIIDCSACSGHGFKFAPAVGARVAALA